MGTWGPGAFENDAALDFLGDQAGALVATINELVDNPKFLDHRFDRAFAALELMQLLAKHTSTALPMPAEIERWKPIFLATFDREIKGTGADAKFQRAQRKALEKVLAALAAHAIQFHRGEPGTPTSALSRRLQQAAARARREGGFTLNHVDLIYWVAPYGEDLGRVWTECDAGDRLIAIAQALGVPVARLAPIVVDALESARARLPADAPASDPDALERWATAAVLSKNSALLPIAAIARAVAHAARAPTQPERNHLGFAIKELLDTAMLDASLIAKAGGMDWTEAMTSPGGPGWAAHHAANAELATFIKARLPAGELSLRLPAR